jgi:hypothetical protein
VKTPAEGPRKVTTLVVGQVKPKVHAVGVGQLRVKVVFGVWNLTSLYGGQETVVGAAIAGNVRVVTVLPVADTVVVIPVKNVPVPLGLLLPNGSVGLPQPGPSGGPLLTSGQGGSVTVLVVVPPFPSGSGTPMGGMLTLGEATIPLVLPPEVML